MKVLQSTVFGICGDTAAPNHKLTDKFLTETVDRSNPQHQGHALDYSFTHLRLLLVL